MNVKVDASELQKRMLSKGIDSSSLSRLTGISRNTIYRIRNGMPCRLSTVELIAEALSCDPEDLLMMEDENNE